MEDDLKLVPEKKQKKDGGREDVRGLKKERFGMKMKRRMKRITDQ